MPSPPHAPGDRGPAVLLVTSNGAGMGHLTRLLAYARRLGPGARAHVFSLSTAVSVIDQVGATWEYCPSHAGFPTDTSAPWHDMLEARLERTLERFRPDVVVFDGTSPYTGFLRARLRYPDLPFVWSRRGLWRAGSPVRGLDRAQFFDRVVEPGEAAAAYDRGPTARMADADRVAPVTYLDADEALARADARAELGLPDDRKVLLVTLGAGNINATDDEVGAVVAAMRRRRPDWLVAVTRAPIRTAADALPEGVLTVSAYPLARLLPAFDAAVSAAGYNGFHELLVAGLPTVFVPNLATATDDQAARARFAADTGAGWCLRDVPGGIDRLVPELTDDSALDQRAALARALVPVNGAVAAAGLVRRTAGWG